MTLFLLSCLFPLCNQPMAYLLQLFWSPLKPRTRNDPTPVSVYSNTLIWSGGAESQKLGRISEERVPMILTLITSSDKGHTRDWGCAGSSAGFQQFQKSFLQCFCITSGMRFSRWLGSILPGFTLDKVLSGTGAGTGALRECQGKLPSATGWKHLSDGCSLREKNAHTHSDSREPQSRGLLPWFSGKCHLLKQYKKNLQTGRISY